jgi:hypothetical protein
MFKEKMKVIKLLLIVTLFSFQLVSCDENKYSHAETVFNAYLKRNFNVSLADINKPILVIPNFGCEGCIKKVEELPRTKKNIGIVSSLNYESESIHKSNEFFHDSKNELERLDLMYSGPYWIFSTDNHIDSIVEIDIFNPDYFLELVSR